MLVIHLPGYDPYFNLAAEEHFFKNSDEDILLIYRNASSIIVGKNQNANAEINLSYVWRNKIPVVRRLSGGGTVFHDLGNVNYTVIRGGEELKKVDFRRYTAPVLQVLQGMGVEAKFTGESDLSINGLKISGNAEHLWRNRILHHGTLLFSSELDALNEAIKVRPDVYRDKAVQSKRKVVTNISEHLPKPISIDSFIDLLLMAIPGEVGNGQRYSLSDKDNRAIRELMEQRYLTWEWNFGRSPHYVLEQKKTVSGSHFEVNLQVKKGIISTAKIRGGNIERAVLIKLESLLIGTRHFPDDVLKKIAASDLLGLLNKVPLQTIIDLLF